MNEILDLILGGLELVFGVRWVAPFLFAAPMLLWAVWLGFDAWRKTAPYITAANARLGVLRDAIGADPSPEAERESFANNYSEVAAALTAGGKRAEALILAWREFHESIVDETETPIRNTNRPAPFFSRAAPKQTRLVFWSNLLVGLGLLLTFLGLIVALHTARKGMEAGADPAAMQESLRVLLVVAGAKFFTSVAGVGGSLILRAVERRLTARTTRATDELCTLLERGLLYVPPQRLAVEQLNELREQSAQLKTFNTDFALQVSERIGAHFQQAMAPVTASLASLNDNMTGMGQSIRDGLGQSAAEAISQATGGELRALSQTLASLGERLETLGTAVGTSGDHAADQIRAAGADFAAAATDIREAFNRLVGQVDGMGEKLAEQNETAARVQAEAGASMLAKLAEAQERSTQGVTEAVEALKSAGANAAAGMQQTVADALADGVAHSQRVLTDTLEQSGEALRSAAAGLSRAVSDAADQIERAKDGFAKSGENAARTAEAMAGVTSHASSVSASLGDAAKGFATAATPVAQAAQALNEAAGRVAEAIEAGRETDGEALRALSGLAEEMRGTQAAAEGAWRDYRARFEGVDKALAATAERLGETLGDSFEQFRQFAQSFDSEMASAVSKLSGAITQIEDYAGSLDDFVEASRKRVPEPAE